MELRHLRYFCAVAENQGFSATARALHVSQSAISEQISSLEKEIGVPLLVREHSRVKLTPHGEIFLRKAKGVIEDAEKAVETARRSLRGEIGTLTIGFFTGGTGTFVPAMIRSFRHLYPGVHISLVDMVPAVQSEALMNGTIDIAFTRPLDPPYKQHLRSEMLYLDPLIAVLPKGHRLAGGPVNIRDLAGERFVLCARETSSAVFDKIISLCSDAGFSPGIVTTSLVWSSVVMLVQAGEGIALLPSNLQQRGASDLAFCPLTSPAAAIGLMMAWRPDRLGPIQKAFLELVRANKPRSK
ncbi:MAG TPA: LysR substrate-binding domain-containing protein [Bryobacteraceae bacterium]|jgi:DNA-binding transcriptional LysR family regulator|nr:LysR substrate-binding domain-containing protein [Bryobacteraceae bacterium]